MKIKVLVAGPYSDFKHPSGHLKVVQCVVGAQLDVPDVYGKRLLEAGLVEVVLPKPESVKVKKPVRRGKTAKGK